MSVIKRLGLLSRRARGLSKPGLVFAVLTVALAAKKKTPANKPVSAKAKENAKVIAKPLNKKKPTLLVKLKEVVICPRQCYVIRTGPKEEGSDFGHDDYNPLSTGVPEATLTKEEMLAHGSKGVDGYNF